MNLHRAVKVSLFDNLQHVLPKKVSVKLNHRPEGWELAIRVPTRAIGIEVAARMVKIIAVATNVIPLYSVVITGGYESFVTVKTTQALYPESTRPVPGIRDRVGRVRC